MSETEQDRQSTSAVDSIRVISLTIPSPGHRMKDAGTGEEVDRSKGAEKGTASVTKPLYAKDQANVFFKGINNTRQAIRRWYTMSTSQWGKHRAMNVADGRLERFREQFDAWKTILQEEVDKLRATDADLGEPPGTMQSYTFLVDTHSDWVDADGNTQSAGVKRPVTVEGATTWDLMQAVAPQALGNWYNPEDYVEWNDFRNLYGMEDFEVISVSPDDLPVAISEEERGRLRTEARSRLERRMQESSLSLANQLLTLVANMATILSKEKPKIFTTLVTNIAELCDNADALNVANDPAINEVIEQARGLTAYETSDLKANANLRRFASEEAREVADRIQQVANRLSGARVLDLDEEPQQQPTAA